MAPVQTRSRIGLVPDRRQPAREPCWTRTGKPKIDARPEPVRADRQGSAGAEGVAGRARASLLSVVFAYATHSTAMGQSNYQITGDVHGLAEQFIEKYLDHGVIAPGFAGASGNIDPWFRVLPKFETANGWIPEPVLLGTMLGEEVVTVSNHIRKSDDRLPDQDGHEDADAARKTARTGRGQQRGRRPCSLRSRWAAWATWP